MEIEDYIERIIEKGNQNDMYILSDILLDALEIMKETDKQNYEVYSIKLYKMAYGNNLTKELAEEIVSKMRPYGEKWSFNEATDIKEQYGLHDIKAADFYAVINSAYNDYQDIFNEDIELYVKFAIDFIEDEDAKEGKVLAYFI